MFTVWSLYVAIVQRVFTIFKLERHIMPLDDILSQTLHLSKGNTICRPFAYPHNGSVG